MAYALKITFFTFMTIMVNVHMLRKVIKHPCEYKLQKIREEFLSLALEIFLVRVCLNRFNDHVFIVELCIYSAHREYFVEINCRLSANII